MIDNKKFKEEILDSINDFNVPNNKEKIKTLYFDRKKEINRPWYKHRRLYLICGPILAATVAVAIVIPITVNQTKLHLNANKGPVTEIKTSLYKITGSNNQIAHSINLLSNASLTLDETKLLPSDQVGSSSFNVIKDLYSLNSFMYSFETLIKNEFDLSYSTTVDEIDTSKYSLSIKDGDNINNSEYEYIPKSTYDGEENFTLEGHLTNQKDEQYAISGSKSGLFGYYNNSIKMYVDEEKTYGYMVCISQDLLSEQAIFIREFRNNESSYLSEFEINFVVEEINKKQNYFINVYKNKYLYKISLINDNLLNINISSDNDNFDAINVKIIEEDGISKYQYTNSLGLDFSLTRK